MNNILTDLKQFRLVFVMLVLCSVLLVMGNTSVNGAPTLFTYYPDPVYEGDEVTFSASSEQTSYEWWISDGPAEYCTVEDTAYSTDSSFSYPFYEIGTWEVCLRVPDEVGGYITQSQSILVGNLPPEILSPLYWNATPEPSVVGEAFNVAFTFIDYQTSGYTCTIDYGDGTGPETGTVANIYKSQWECTGPDHTYAASGSFSIQATVTDSVGDFDNSDYYDHTVNAPEHLFSWTPTEPAEGGGAAFTAIPGYNNHYWTKSAYPGEACNSQASNSYTSPVNIYFWSSGVYQVCLSMYDNITYQEVTDSQYVTVTNTEPTNIEVYTSDQPAFPGAEISVYGYFRDYQDGPYTVVLNWGDGSADVTFTVNDTYIPNQFHTYTTVGEYIIQVSVTDKDGATGTGSTTQYISNLMVEPDSMWMASNTLPTRIELQGFGIPEGSVSFSIAIEPGYGSLGTPSAPTCLPYERPNLPSGVVFCSSTVIYTPADTPSGGTEDVFLFTMTDGISISPLGTMYLWVGPNGAPTALDAEQTVGLVSPSYVILTATDPDIYNYYSDQVTFSIVSQPQNGTLGALGMPNCVDAIEPITENYIRQCTSAVLYTPTPGTTATADSFSFKVNDTHQDSNVATVSLSLHAPVSWHVNTANFYSDGTCDETDCSFFEAINAAMIGDNIDFTLTLPATITLGGEQHIRIDKSISITGPGAQLLVISGVSSSAVFEFNNFGQPMIASISGVTIRDGRASEGGGILIREKAEVTVTDCVIGPNNIVTYAGGGIANMGGTLNLINSTVVENHGTGTLGGAGIVSAWSSAKTTITNSTVTGNVTNNYGGGILAAYGGRVNLIHTTVTGNLANENYLAEPWGGGGGVAIIDDGSVTILNSIIAGNIDLTDPTNHTVKNDVDGAFTSLGGNLIGDGTGSGGWVTSDLVGDSVMSINPLLDTLSLNAPGTTPSFALLPGSPAIDAAPTCEAETDQRGIARPQGTACDIGAFEVEQTVPTGSLKISKIFDPLSSGFTGSFTIFYDCGGEFWAYINLSAGEEQTFSDIPVGSQCRVAELTLPTPPTGWSFGTPTFSPVAGTVTITENVAEVVVTNTIRQLSSQLTTTRATCSQFSSNTAPDLTGLQYSVPLNRKTGATVIKSVTPSSFAYFIKLTTSEGGDMGINQINDSEFPAMIIDPTKIVIYDDACVSIMRSWTGTKTVDANQNLTLTNLPAGTVYVKVPFAAKSVYGQTVSSPYPAPLYTFTAGYAGGALFTEDDLVLEYKP